MMAFDDRTARALRIGAWLVPAILLAPILFMAHGCDDDLAISVARAINHGYFRAAWNAAVGWGRFYEVFAYNVAQFPFLFGRLWVANLFRIGAAAAALFSFWCFVRLLTRQRSLADLATILCAVFMYTGPAYPLHCWPLWFQTPLTLTFFSWSFFLRGLREKSRSGVWGSAALLLGAMMFYETFVLFAAGHLFLYLLEKTSSPQRSWAQSALEALIETSPVLLAATIYTAVFFWFQKLHPSQYVGSQASLPYPLPYLETLLGLTWPVIPVTPRNLLRTGQGLLHLRGISSYAYVAIFMGAVSWALAPLLLRPPKVTLTPKTWSLGILSLGFIFLPNSLYGLTEHYRRIGADGRALPYIGTFYGTFFLALFFICATIAAAARFPRWGYRISALLVALSALVGSVRMAAGLTEWRKSAVSWEIAEQYIHYLQQEKAEPHALVAPRLWEAKSVTFPDEYDYWTHFFQLKLGDGYRVTRQPEISAPATTFLSGLTDSLDRPPVTFFGPIADQTRPSWVSEVRMIADGDRRRSLRFEWEGGPGVVNCQGGIAQLTGSTLLVKIASESNHGITHCSFSGGQRVNLQTAQLVVSKE